MPVAELQEKMQDGRKGPRLTTPQGRRPLRVCMVAYTFYETDSRVMRYAEALAQRGDQVDVFALRKPGTPRAETLGGVRVRRLQGRLYNEKSLLSYVWRILLFLTRAYIKSRSTICERSTTLCIFTQCLTSWFFRPFYLAFEEPPLFLTSAISCLNSMPANSGSQKSRLVSGSSAWPKGSVPGLRATSSLRITLGRSGFCPVPSTRAEAPWFSMFQTVPSSHRATRTTT